jgi:cation efflux family protein
MRDAHFAMRLSLMVGLVMLVGKTTVYLMTHSAAIFSDAAESVVHVVAVGFAWFSLRLSTKSASPQFLYGYERITFFSAGFEGAMIVSSNNVPDAGFTVLLFPAGTCKSDRPVPWLGSSRFHRCGCWSNRRRDVLL